MANENADIEGIDTGESAPAGDDLPSIESKYREQMRQIVTQKIDLPVSALLGMLKEQIKLNPEFQRRDRWGEAAQSRFIESLVMNVPVPPVFLGEDEYGHYVVLDGRQRLTSVKRFLENVLKLEGLEVWHELNGKTLERHGPTEGGQILNAPLHTGGGHSQRVIYDREIRRVRPIEYWWRASKAHGNSECHLSRKVHRCPA